MVTLYCARWTLRVQLENWSSSLSKCHGSTAVVHFSATVADHHTHTHARTLSHTECIMTSPGTGPTAALQAGEEGGVSVYAWTQDSPGWDIQ